MELIPISKRESEKSCHYCGSNKNVKYSLTNYDNNDVKLEVCCCSKCALRYNEKNIFK